MARTEQEIIDTMDEEQTQQSALSGLTSTSQNSIFKVWKALKAKVQRVLEQRWDTKQAEIEAALLAGAVGSESWAVRKTLEFQYDGTNPQLMESVNNVPRYTVIDASKRIITRARGRTSGGFCFIIVAKNEPPEQLSTDEVAALQGYLNNISLAGQRYVAQSYDPELLFMEAEIFFKREYSGVFQDAAVAAIESAISNLGDDFQVWFRINDLIAQLQTVTGFVDIVIANMSVRDNATPWGSGTDLVVANEIVAHQFESTSGYMINETTSGETFADKLTFTAV